MVREPSCPLCGRESRRLFAKRGIWIRGCMACTHRFAEYEVGASHVGEIYGDAYFEGGGAGYVDYTGGASYLRDAGRWYGALLRRHSAAGRVLEVGAAAGYWLEGLLATGGFEAEAVEPNPRMAALARERLGIAVHATPLERFEPAAPFDLVCLIQVLAHFADPRRSLERVARWTVPGGLVLVETWDRESLVARAFGRSWHEYSPPSVLHWFSKRGLRELAETLGLREVARGRPQKRIHARHAKSLLRHSVGGSFAGRLLASAATVVPDALVVPYPGDDLFWMLLRKG